ncbi:MAG: DUF4270 domain-containing protein [Prevotella sp.]|nr:DUF4270 domain-containing protein [Prevotella sp.]
MNIKLFTGLFFISCMMISCNDSTDNIGSSLAGLTDGVKVESTSFDVSSQSIIADSVLSRNTVGYLGKVLDPETGSYVTGDFMTQFYSLENYRFPAKDSLVTYDAGGNLVKGVIKADSCEIRLFYSKHYGDSTKTMKLTAYELSKPMNEDRNYYSNFDPMQEGYVRTNGIHKDKVYTLTDFNVPKNRRDTSTYTPYITVKLNEPYTDAQGRSYANYGTYVMSKYYDNPANFKNAYTFRNNVVPGFLFKHKSGIWNMAYINISQLNVYFKYSGRVAYKTRVGGNEVTQYRDTVYHGVTVFWGTEEVLQSTTITNDSRAIASLASDASCTYLKTPAGIFTEMTLPVEEIMNGHEKDTISVAKLSISRINNAHSGDNAFRVPEHVLMIPKDSLYSFFENNKMYNNKNSFVATWSYGTSSSPYGNTYDFNNISGMISAMYHIDRSRRSANWNKVVLVPVSLSTTSTSNQNSYSSRYGSYPYNSSASSTATVTRVSNDMSLSSTKLVRGTTSNSPIKIDVIYSKFK